MPENGERVQIKYQILKNGKFVYLRSDINFRKLAEENSFSDEEMYHAGWFKKSIINGAIAFEQIGSEGVLLPYMDKKGNIVSFHIRQTSSNAEAKYLGTPAIRELKFEVPVESKLYGSENLDKVEGKPIILTEGEIKCRVTKELSSIDTFGIPGIDQVDEDIIGALVKAKPSCCYVVFDYDPLAKGLMRGDLATDSERAAYRTARRLIDAGIADVKIVILPSENGDKVGSDDLLLKKNGTGKFNQALESALSPDQFAGFIGIDPDLDEVSWRTKTLNNALLDYTIAREREGKPADTALEERALSAEQSLAHAKQIYERDVYYSINVGSRPFQAFDYLGKVDVLPSGRGKYLFNNKGEEISQRAFCSEILKMIFVPSDFSTEGISPTSSFLRLPFSMNDLIEYEKGAGGSIVPYLLKGSQAFQGQGIEFFNDKKNLWKAAVAGFLLDTFPLSAYRYETDIDLELEIKRGTAKVARIPLTIFKKDTDKAVAVIDLVEINWQGSELLPLDFMSKNLRLTESFLRGGSESFHLHAVREVANLIREFREGKYDMYGKHDNYENSPIRVHTQKICRELGIPLDAMDQHSITALEGDRLEEFYTVLKYKHLLKEAVYLDLMEIERDGSVRGKRTGSLVFMEEVDREGNTFALRTAEINKKEGRGCWLETQSSEEESLIKNARRGLPCLRFGFEESKNKRIIVVPDHRNLLRLTQTGEKVISLNPHGRLINDLFKSIIDQNPSEILFVGFDRERNAGILYRMEDWINTNELRANLKVSEPEVLLYETLTERKKLVEKIVREAERY